MTSTSFRLVLLAGTKHSRQNVQNILGWVRANGVSWRDVAGYVRSLTRRGFLEEDDAEFLERELTAS